MAFEILEILRFPGFLRLFPFEASSADVSPHRAHVRSPRTARYPLALERFEKILRGHGVGFSPLLGREPASGTRGRFQRATVTGGTAVKEGASPCVCLCSAVRACFYID